VESLMPSEWAAFRAFVFALGLACGCASDGGFGFKSNTFKNDNNLGDSQIDRKSNDTDRHDQNGDTEADIDDMFSEMNSATGASTDRPTRNEDDPLRDIFESQRAQEIERHLGIE
jgi:hypothetical protein